MSVTNKELEAILKKDFPDGDLIIKDNYGDGSNFSILVRSKKFKDLPTVKQHQMVMKSLKETLATKLHAVSIKTQTL